MEILIGGVCLLVAVTIIGHGLWVLVSLMFGDQVAARLAATPHRCPRCSMPLLRPDCDVCHWPRVVGAKSADTVRALETLQSQINQLGRLGALDTTVCQKLTEEIGAALAGNASAQAAATAQAQERAPAQAPPQRSDETIVMATPVFEQTPRKPGEIVPPTPAEPVVAASAAPQPQPPRPIPPLIAPKPARSAPPQPPARSWTDWLAGFMEERNIRWGELVGGLLIVCSSIALVISFWSAIDSRPWLKFLLFNGVTAAIFGAGFYSEYRWRLKTTSRGLLTIGCLLVPLNFLAIAAFSSAPGAQGLATIVGEGLSAALFAVLVYFAGQVLVRRDELWLMLGLLVPALSQLLVRRLIDPSASLATVAWVAALPTVCYLVVNLWQQRGAAKELVLSERQTHELLRFLGLTTFAVVLPLALLLYKTAHPILTLRQLPALAGLLGFVPLSAGLLIWQQLAGRSLSALRTAGTAVGIFGAAVTLVGLIIGWPEPSALVPAAILEFAIFTFVAWRFGIPAAHLVAAACLAIAYLLLAHLSAGEIAWSGNSPEHLARTLISGESGTLLAPLVLLYAGLTFVARRRADAGWWAFGAAFAGCMTVSVAMLAWFGWGNRGVPLAAGWIYLLYAVCWLAIAARHSHAAPSWIGLALLLAGTLQEVVYHYGEALGLVHPLVAALLLFSSAAVATTLLEVTRLIAAHSALPLVAWRWALAVSCVAAAGLVVAIPSTTALWQATHWAWIAVLWGSIVLVFGWLPVGMLFQVSLVLSTIFATVAFIEERTWFKESPHPWLDPWTLQALGIAVVGLNFAWALLRLALNRSPSEPFAAENSSRVRDRLASPWLSVDRITTGLLIALLVSLGAVAVLPGVLHEITPVSASASQLGSAAKLADEWRREGLLHTHVADFGSWALLFGLLVVIATTLRAKASLGWQHVALLVAMVSCPLLASRWESQHAVASALAWLSVIGLLAGSILVWGRTSVARFAAQLGWPTLAGDPRAAREATLWVFVLSLFVPALLACIIAGQALSRGAISNTGPWSQMLATVLASSVMLLIAAVICWSIAERFLHTTLDGTRPTWPVASPALLLMLGVVPAVGLVIYNIAVAIAQHPIRGPDPASWFGQIGWPLNSGGPLLLVAVALVGFALRERSSGFALAGGVMSLLAASAAHLSASAVDIETTFTAIRWAQLAAAVAAIYTICWIALVAWDRRREGRYGLSVGGTAYDIQASIAPAIAAVLMLWGWFEIVGRPFEYRGDIVPPQFADGWAAASLALVALSVWLAAAACERRLSHLATSALLVALATFAAGIATRWDHGNWLAYNTLNVGHMLIAAGLTVAAWLRTRTQSPAAEAVVSAPTGSLWPALQAGIVVLLALRQLDREWWSAGGLALVGLLLAPALAWIFQRRRYLYAAVPLVNAAGSLLARDLDWLHEIVDVDFLCWNIALLAIPGPLWLAIDRLRIAPRRFVSMFQIPPVHRLTTTLSVFLLVYVVGVGLWADAAGTPASHQMVFHWLALAATCITVLACLWDETGGDALALLYVVGLAACGMVLDSFDLEPKWLLWTGTMLLAAYALATSYLWSQRQRLRALATAIGIAPPPHDLAALGRLIPANSLLIAAVVFLTFVIQTSIERTDLRVLASLATLVQVASLALLAVGTRRGLLQYAALTVGAIGAVYFGWAWLQLGTTFTLLHAVIIVAVATAAVAALYGFGLTKLLPDGSEWLAAAQRLTPVLAAISLGALVLTLAREGIEFAEHGEVRIASLAIATVAITLASLALASLAAAIIPGRDPLSLSERGRTSYVYAAEIILTLLFVHIRITMPWLFSGFFQQYWPLIVMGIAFLGVGFAELFRRRGQNVLAEPLENTGVLLPLLPVLGYWATTSRVDYSLVLLTVGMLYAGLAIARRSFGFGVLAALAANGGLWFLLGRQEGWGFLAHPQVWLIPPAVCVLGASYLNRRQLSESQMTALRYVSSMAIYLSSTADIFLNGVAQNPWLPLILAGFSILGIFAGILLRVRSFLFMGTGFLCLSLFTIIWYAAVDLDQTWIWYVCLLLLGVAIFAVFTVFEKKRQQMLEVVERLKTWEA